MPSPNPDRLGNSKTSRTTQDMANSAFDETYQIPLILPVIENGGSLYRLQGDALGNLKVNVAVGGGSGLGDASAANQLLGNASLTTIAAKDFATQTTLAAIKAKTDNLDVLLSTRTKPADAQHVIVDSGVTTGLTDTQLRATPVPVSGTVTTGGITDTQIRATPLPVSGTVSTGLTQPLTDTQLRATPVPVSLATAPTTPVTGAFFQATQPVSLATNTPTLQTGANIVGKVGIDQTTDGTTNKVFVGNIPHVIVDSAPASGGGTQYADGAAQATPTGTQANWNEAGTQRATSLAKPLPIQAGTGVTIPVSLATNTPTLATGSNVIGSISNTAFTANAGTNLNTSALALDATLTGGTQKAIARGGAKGSTTAADVTSVAVDANTQALHTNVTNFPATQAVSIASMPSTPVTGPLTDTQLRATAVPVSGPITDTQIRATPLPISGAVTNANLDVALSTRLKPADTLAGVTTVTTVGAVTSITNALPAGTNAIGTTLGPTLTKGTQGATGYSVQDLRDAGRNTRIFMLDAYTAAPVAEAMQTVVQWYGNAAVGGTVSPAVVPAGKTLRLTGYKIMYQSLATVGYGVVRIRVNTAGTAVLASPLVASFEAGSGAGATTVAMTGGITTETGSFPEGLEIPAASGVGFSLAGYGPTGALTAAGGVRFEVHGYEY